MVNRLLNKPLQRAPAEARARFERFNLSENPFPANPFVNRESSDKRINGDVYEEEIRRSEYEQIERHFLRVPQSDPNHLRLGYIMDTSYVGRGNGKSAFLVNLQQAINRQYCLDLSDNVNKCFAIYVTPEPGGRTKTFPSLVELVFAAIAKSGVIENSLAMLRLQGLGIAFPAVVDQLSTLDEQELVRSLNSHDWYGSVGAAYDRVSAAMFSDPRLDSLPPDFPLCRERQGLFTSMVTRAHLEQRYSDLRPGRERLEFVFSHLVSLFQAAGFTGAHLLVDDFERVPSFQSARQMADFALELRSCLFDGLSTNARTGFYAVLLVLHAGDGRQLLLRANDN